MKKSFGHRLHMCRETYVYYTRFLLFERYIQIISFLYKIRVAYTHRVMSQALKNQYGSLNRGGSKISETRPGNPVVSTAIGRSIRPCSSWVKSYFFGQDEGKRGLWPSFWLLELWRRWPIPCKSLSEHPN
jgi:hypothetical protein